MKPDYIISLEQVPQLKPEERKELKKVTRWFSFQSNDYYLSLINWQDPDDPIRRLIIPQIRELDEWGTLDPSSENLYTKAPGLQHKYRETALLLVSDMCGGLCRFCFRKRLFVNDSSEVVPDVTEALRYISNHQEITNVLLTGGDPLMLETGDLEPTVRKLREIDHVQIIRIGSKMPAYNPYRIIDDPELLEMIRKYSTPEKRIYIMAQFNHPRELSEPAMEAVRLLQGSGAILMNQTPMIHGINDNPEVLSMLFKKLSFMGVSPYYVFQCRPAKGNRIFSVPLEEAYAIFEKARGMCSGLAKRARFVMSHKKGKIEVVGVDATHTYFRYNQAAEPADLGRFVVCERNPDACWFDDYRECTSD